jgi:cell division protein FtsQ
MKKLKKILIIALWFSLATGLLLSMGFVNGEQDSMPAKELDVTVKQEEDLSFLNSIDVRNLIIDRGDSIVGQPLRSINVPEIEKALNSHPDISNAEVYMSIDGRMSVKVKQRRPIVRIINSDGESYYLDENGRPMPLSDKFTARVLVANGDLMEPYGARYMYAMEDIAADSSLKQRSMLDEIYAMAKLINADPFWKAQVQQIYVNKDKELEIVPLAGDQKILFGDTTFMEEKFEKLLVFYQQGLNTTGWWNKYSLINLKFKNQVVCTRKEPETLQTQKIN